MALKKTHTVLDTFYTPEEGQECFDGTLLECQNFVSEQHESCYGYIIVPMTKKEIENHPDNQ